MHSLNICRGVGLQSSKQPEVDLFRKVKIGDGLHEKKNHLANKPGSGLSSRISIGLAASSPAHFSSVCEIIIEAYASVSNNRN